MLISHILYYVLSQYAYISHFVLRAVSVCLYLTFSKRRNSVAHTRKQTKLHEWKCIRSSLRYAQVAVFL